MITKEQIVKLLETDDRAVCRALVLLNERQTSDEQASEQTRYRNGAGFRPCHAVMGTSMAKQIARKGRLELSAKQIAYWRVRDKSGAMRIGIYAGQLLEEAEKKAAAKGDLKVSTGSYAHNAAARDGLVRQDGEFVRPAIPATEDVANLMERQMVLGEALQYAVASDSPNVNVIQKELDEIDAFMAKVRNKNA